MTEQGWTLSMARQNIRWALILGLIMPTVFSLSVKADTRGDIINAFNRCSSFADNRTWLNCIYGAVQPMRAQLGLPPAPAFQTNLVPIPMPNEPVPPPPAPARPRSSGGGFLSFLTGGQAVLTNEPLTAYSFDRDGLFTVTLDNGEVWHEMEGGPLSHWQFAPSHYRVSISKGALNSFNLLIVGEGIQYKVQRVR